MTPLFKVERISPVLKIYGVPDDCAYEVVAILADRKEAEAYARECRVLAQNRKVRVTETHLTHYPVVA